MSDLDTLIKEKAVPLRRKIVDVLAAQYPQVFEFINHYLRQKDNRVGMQVTENGNPVGNYTLHLDGAYISEVESGKLDSEIHSPFGVIRPYVVIERSVLEEMLRDEERLVNDPFGASRQYLRATAIRFL